jgi:hypothetical protein
MALGGKDDPVRCPIDAPRPCNSVWRVTRTTGWTRVDRRKDTDKCKDRRNDTDSNTDTNARRDASVDENTRLMHDEFRTKHT